MSAPMTPQREAEIRVCGFVRPKSRPGYEWTGRTADERDLARQGEALDAARRDLLAELDRVRAELAEQKRLTKRSVGQSVFLRSELATRPSRTELLTVLGHDVETAIAPLKGEARKGADMVLRAIREMAAEPTVPTVAEATS